MNQFDTWRENYDLLTIKDQIEYHNDLYDQYPEQAHFNYLNVIEALSDNITVLEFGSWRGDLALLAMKDFDIKEWFGIEICTKAIQNTRCKELKYVIPKEFNWFETTIRPECDVIIATHFIEHLSDSHFESLVKYCSGVPFIYFESPLTDNGQTWEGYEGTHKLSYGWNKVVEIMKEYKYFIFKKYPEGIIFKL